MSAQRIVIQGKATFAGTRFAEMGQRVGERSETPMRVSFTEPERMADPNEHVACVDAWIARAAGEAPAAIVPYFERGFAAVWQRAHRTLGDVTLSAVAERVLFDAAERYPALASIRVGALGLEATDLAGLANGSDAESLLEGLRFVLVELLTVLGNLTADVLTPALHSELAKLDSREPTVPTEPTKTKSPRRGRAPGADEEPER